MSNEISRGRVGLQESVVIGTTEGVSEPINNQNASMLMVKLTSGTTTSVDIYGSPTKDGTYLQLADSTSTDSSASMDVTKWIVLPKETFASPWIKLIGDAAGVASVVGKS
jgi:hypothetical protein